MNVAQGSTDDHALIQQYHCDGTSTSGYYEIVNEGNGKCVDITGGWVGDSVPLQQYTRHGGDNQQ